MKEYRENIGSPEARAEHAPSHG